MLLTAKPGSYTAAPEYYIVYNSDFAFIAYEYFTNLRKLFFWKLHLTASLKRTFLSYPSTSNRNA